MYIQTLRDTDRAPYVSITSTAQSHRLHAASVGGPLWMSLNIQRFTLVQISAQSDLSLTH
jgi:hypothetical protein